MKQVIVVKLDGIFYGIDVDIVQEVVYSYAERSLPEAPNFIEGLAYVRDQLLPIVRTKRLFNSSFFDLYGNKKVLVLSFARMQGSKYNKEESDTSSVGIVIDDVVGIESYEDSDLVSVPSVYSTKVSHEIVGFIKRRGVDIAILNIMNFFLDQDGNFKYQKYVSKTEVDEYTFTKEDVSSIEKSASGRFPFIALTRKPIFIFLSRIAGFEGTTIQEYLRGNPNFFSTNIHTKKKVGKEILFANAPDMYMLLEYILSQEKTAKEMNILVIDHKGSSVMESLAIALHSRNKGKKQKYQFFQFITDGQLEPNQFNLEKEKLSKVTEELIPEYFDFDIKSHKYRLKQEFISQFRYDHGDIMSLENLNKKFDVIYAPNFLVSNIDEIQKFVGFFERVVNRNGILALGLLEDIEDFAKSFKKYYIKSRLVFVKG